MNTCCFSGHREIEESEYDEVVEKTDRYIEELIGRDFCCFMVGGAKGYDYLAAQRVLLKKKEHMNIQLLIAFPYAPRNDEWDNIIKQADLATILADHYYRGCMQARNRYMVEQSQACVCYMRKETGGTVYTVNYAKKKGLDIFRV